MTDLAGQVADHERRLKQQESDIQHLYHGVRETHQEVRSTRGDIATLDRKLKDTRGDIATLDREIRSTRTDIAAVDGDVKQVGRELRSLDGWARQEVGWLHRALSGVMAHMGVEPPGDEEE